MICSSTLRSLALPVATCHIFLLKLEMSQHIAVAALHWEETWILLIDVFLEFMSFILIFLIEFSLSYLIHFEFIH